MLSICKFFKRKPDCRQAVEAMKGLMQARCQEQKNKLRERWQEKVNRLNNKIHQLNQVIGKQEVEIEYWQDKYYAEASIPKRPDYCQPDECPFKSNSKKKSKLAIRKGKLCYKDGGTKPVKLVGVSRWEALARAKRLWYSWGDKSLHWYEEQLINSGINYVRHGSVSDMDFVRCHCERMAEADIIVELTIHNSQVNYDMGNPKEIVNATIDLPNVFYDVHNEFLGNEEDVNTAHRLIDYIREKGGICSAGAWGHSRKGKTLSEQFNPVRSRNQIISVHREWTPDWISKYTGYGKPVIRNEFFARYKPLLSLEDVKKIFVQTFGAGGQGCQYYGFAYEGLPGLKKYDPFNWKKILDWAGWYCKELNQ